VKSGDNVVLGIRERIEKFDRLCGLLDLDLDAMGCDVRCDLLWHGQDTRISGTDDEDVRLGVQHAGDIQDLKTVLFLSLP
jgi:hypothetical protein